MDQAPWAIYTRISYARKPDGTIDTLGVERQDPPCRELVARKGGQVVKVFVDNDRSAFKGTRRDFEEMLSWAREGKVRGIAVWDCDRLSRNSDRDNLRIIELAERFGVELATVCGEYDLSTSAGRMLFRIVGALAVLPVGRGGRHQAEDRLRPRWRV
jgi:DNA invertase Pin-like site-specific DNA recombinase